MIFVARLEGSVLAMMVSRVMLPPRSSGPEGPTFVLLKLILVVVVG
jgi:hypothetical protein